MIAGHRDRIDQLVEAALVRYGTPGACIAVEAWDQRLERSYGRARLDPDVKMSADTVFAIGSISKQFTAAAVLRLVDAGSLSLDDDALMLLCGRTHGSSTSVRQLLSHTSGISSIPDARLLTEAAPFSDPTEVLSCVREKSVRAGGQTWRYSNAGYILLGLLIERVTDQTYSAIIQNELLGPLHLASTYVGKPAPGVRLADGHIGTLDRSGATDGPTLKDAFASGAIYSTAADLLRWTTALHRGQVMSRVSYETMIRPTQTADATGADYGCGVFIADCHGYRELSHDGYSGGFSCQAAHYPDAGLSAVVLTNGGGHRAEQIEKEITSLVLGISHAEPRSQGGEQLPLGPYVGIYRYGSIEVPVWIEEDRLRLRSPTGSLKCLTQLDRDVFADEMDSSIHFKFRVVGDSADHCAVLRNGKLIAALPKEPGPP